MFDLKGKTALVSGASRGIGKSVALCLAKSGADLVLWARDAEALSEMRADVQALGVRATAEAFDIRDASALNDAMARAIDLHGHIDAAVVNAGVNKLKPFLDWQQSEWEEMMAINLFGAIHTMQAVGRHMTQRKFGSVIVMASIYSFVGAPGNSIYCLTKGGLMQLAKGLAVEWAAFGVRVNAICPGWIETDLTAPYMVDSKSVDAGLRNIPLRRFGSPDDIGPMAVYLASDEARWVTGQSFVVDGGQLAK